jgi:hypothetical protein
VLALQAFAFLLGVSVDNLDMPQSNAWLRNSFVHGVALLGPLAWTIAGLVTALGLYIAVRGPYLAGTNRSKAQAR